MRSGTVRLPDKRGAVEKRPVLFGLKVRLELLMFVVATCPVASLAEPIESLAGTMPASGDYGAVLSAIDEIGAQATSLSVYWDDLQRDGVYVADPDWPAIAQAVYPPRGISIQLTFSVIDTLTDRRPEELQELAWDDPQNIQRFVAVAQETLERMPDVTLVSIAIGNEVDGHLFGTEVEEYARFFQRARDALSKIRPHTPISIKVTWSGFRDRPEIRALAQRGDVISLTWYPMNDAYQFLAPEDALAEMSDMDAAADGPWELAEVGYSSNGCGAASEAAQSAFHTGLSDAAQSYPDLRLIQRVWSHDISPDEVAAYAEYYQTDADCFRSFVGSLGLRTNHGTAKLAFDALALR